MLKKMFIRIGLPIFLTVLILSILLYFNHANTIRQQYTSSADFDTQQIEYNLSAKIDTMRIIAKGLGTQRAIQEYLFKGDAISEEEMNEVSSQLSFYKNQNQYIHSIALISNTGESIWETIPILTSSSLPANFIYISDFTPYLSEDWYQDVKDTSGQLLTLNHFLPDNESNAKTEVYSFIMPIYPMENYSPDYAKIIINIDAIYFTTYLQQISQKYDSFVWAKKDGGVYYETSDQSAQAVSIDQIDISESKVLETFDSATIVSVSDNTNNVFILSLQSTNPVMVEKNNYLLREILFLVLFACIVFLFLSITFKSLSTPLVKLTSTIESITEDILPEKETLPDYVDKTTDEIGVLRERFAFMMQMIEQRSRDQIKYERQIKALELRNLITQINPHFLYNTLNSIIFLAEKYHASDITEITRSLVMILQENIKIGEQNLFTTLQNEIRILKSYDIIQRYRYPGLYELFIYIPDRYASAKIPKLILQPFLENSIIHGFFSKKAKGKILVSAYKKDETLILTITDNGVGFNPKRLNKTDEVSYEINEHNLNCHHSIGISNIRSRLKIHYGDHYQLDIFSRENLGTKIQISIPYSSVIEPSVQIHTVYKIKKQ